MGGDAQIKVVPAVSTQLLPEQPSTGESSRAQTGRELDPVPSKDGQNMETEHEREREREHGKEERNPISHCIGMRKEGKSWANLLEELDPPELLSIPLSLNLSSSFQAPGQTRKRRRLPFLSLSRLCLLHTSNSLTRLSTRGPHFLDATICNFTHWQARYRVRRHHTDEYLFVLPGFPLLCRCPGLPERGRSACCC